MTADIVHATEETQLAGARQDSKSEGVLAVMCEGPALTEKKREER